MKTYVAVLLAGAMLSATAFAAEGDSSREERFKAKYGRYTPTEEVRLQALADQDTSQRQCTGHECCSKRRPASRDNSRMLAAV